MAYAMAKVVAFLCMALLVAHVESARLLQQYYAGGVTAGTYATRDMPDAEAFAEHTEVPVTQYNYNLPAGTTTTEEASADEGVYATEGMLVGETTSGPPPAEPYVFDAQHGDGSVYNLDDTTTEDFDTPADQQVVHPASDPTSLAMSTREFEFQEAPDEDGNQVYGPVLFAFDETPPSP